MEDYIIIFIWVLAGISAYWIGYTHSNKHNLSAACACLIGGPISFIIISMVVLLFGEGA